MTDTTSPPPPPPPLPSENQDQDQEQIPPPKGGPEWWRRTFAYKTGLGMTPAQRLEYEQDRTILQKDGDCKRCEKYRDYLMNYSPIIRFLLTSISTISPTHTSPLSPQNIKCLPCDTPQWGGFSPNHGVLLCANVIRTRKEAEDALAHELVHVYDHLRFGVEWADLKHHACSEIRASSLSGECRWTREAFTRGIWDFTRQHQACVRRRAVLSIMNNKNCKDKAEAERVVDSVWESCFADTRPFREIYR